MAVYVLGAPGSGKTTVRAALAERLPDRVVIDWDDFMGPAGALAGSDVRRTPSTWAGYRDLVRAVLDSVGDRLVVLGVCTPAECAGWPIDRWLLLDCSDEERSRRLVDRPDALEDALLDAAEYRSLGLETIDSTGLPPERIARLLAASIDGGSASFSDRWTVRTQANQATGSGDVAALLRRAADYVESLGPVHVTGVVLRREPAAGEDEDDVLALTASFDRTRSPVDLDYLDPRLAAGFDDGYEPRDDFDFMLALAAELDARTIVDLGCGTGRLATSLATDGRRVIAVDPAPAMIDVARTRADADRVEWRVGDAGTLGSLDADLVVMTGNVSGYIVDDHAWDEVLRAIHAALRPDGHLAFGSRNVAGRAWERWEGDEMELVSVVGDRVRVDGHIVFAEAGEELLAGSEYRFRTLDQLTESLTRTGFSVERLYGDWVHAPFADDSEEMVVVARSTPPFRR